MSNGVFALYYTTLFSLKHTELCDLNEWILISVEKNLVDLVIFEAINEDMIAIAETNTEGGLNLLDYTQKYREEYKYQITVVLFFSIWVLFHEHSRITGLQEKGEGIPLTCNYHLHLLHRYLGISREITAESSPLHIVSSRTWTRTFGFGVQVTNH